MRGTNSLFLIGRVGASPEVLRTRGGRAWCPLRVATDREAWEVDGSRVDRTDWHEVQLVGQAAELAERCVRRGTIVAIEGSITYDPWEDAHGQRHHQTTIVATRLVVLGSEGLRALKHDPWVRRRRP